MKCPLFFNRYVVSTITQLALMAASPANAQDKAQSESVIPLTNYYILGSVGTSSLTFDQPDIDGRLGAAGATQVLSSVNQRDLGYKLQFGYMFSPYVGIEGGWVDLGKFRYSTSTATGSSFADVSAQGVNLVMLGAWPVADHYALIGRLGLFNAKVKAHGPANSASDTSTKLNLGLGAMYHISPKVAIRAEWERFFKLGDEATTGQGDIDLWSVGVRYSF